MGIPAYQQGDRYLKLQDVVDLLLGENIISKELAEKMLVAWKASGEHPLNLISANRLADNRRPGKYLFVDEVMNILAEKWNIKYQRVDLLNVPLEVVGTVIPHAYAKRLRIVPIEVKPDKVVILTAEPFATSWVDEVKAQVKKPIELRLCTPRQITHILSEIYVVQKAFKGIAIEQGSSGAQKLKLLRQGKIEELDNLIQKSKGRQMSAQDGFVANIVDWLLNFAAIERASDIHLEPKKGLAVIRFRVDGDLRTVYRLDHDTLNMVISRLKILGDMKLDEKRKPQDGGFKRDLENGRQVEMRLSVVPTNYGEKLVIRIFDKSVVGDDLSFIGFNEEDMDTWYKLIAQPQGLILVTGPTGSGKTTTLYTTLKHVATPEVNVCTAEDPIEMEVDCLNQIQVNPAIGVTFAECIRSFLRQDPDIIMVGEIRDLETAEMAIQSSLTGHLVFSTLHTNGALATIQRLIDIGIPTYLLNSSITGILAQRLVKKLCPFCKEKKPVDKSKWEALLEGEEFVVPETCFEAVGCEECKNTGYLGRIGVYELVKFDSRLKKLIHAKIEIAELKEKTKGMFTSIRMNGARKILNGETTIDEVLKVVY